MAIEADLFAALTGHAGLSALVGSRVYPLILPQNPTYPAVTYQRISTPMAQVVTGAVAAASTRFQVNVWANTYSSAVNVAAQIRAALLAMTGATVTVHEVLLDNETEGWADESGIYSRILDVIILHSE